MATREMVVAVYDGFESANQAYQALLDEGFFRNDVGLVAVDYHEDYGTFNFRFERLDESVLEEMGYSALLVNSTFDLMPVSVADVGSVVAAGSLSGMLGRADGAAGGLKAALVRLGVPAEKAEDYAVALRRGYALVTVQVRTTAAMSSTLTLLQRSRPVNLHHRLKQGWMGFEPAVELLDGQEVIGRYPHAMA